MHRSGTSAITRGIKELGVNLGNNLMPPAVGNNDKGFWEDLEIFALNEEVLAELGCSWNSLRLIGPDELMGPRLDPLRLRAAKVITKKLDKDNRFGFKDPRVSRLLPFWQKVFSDLRLDDRYVIALRNPLSVANSLAARDGFSPEKSYLLWLEHMISAMIGTESKPRVVIDYDLLMNDPIHQVRRIASVVGIKSGRVVSRKQFLSYTGNYLEESLRHSRFDLAAVARDPRLPELVLEAYRRLVDFATDKVSPQDPLAQKMWYRVEKTLRSLAPIYGFLDREIQGHTEAQHTAAERDVQITRLNQVVAERDGQLANLNQAVAERDGQIARLNQVLVGRTEQIGNLNQAVAELERQRWSNLIGQLLRR